MSTVMRLPWPPLAGARHGNRVAVYQEGLALDAVGVRYGQSVMPGNKHDLTGFVHDTAFRHYLTASGKILRFNDPVIGKASVKSSRE